MADETVKAWQKITRQLVGSLPGDWSIGRSGVKTLLVRQPFEWVVLWIGISRVRAEDRPRLMGGITPLVREFYGVSITHGLSMPVRPGAAPSVDLTAEDALESVRGFVDAVQVEVEPWTPERLAAEAEEQFAQPPEDRLPPLRFTDVAGWRVVLNSGDPVEPARESAKRFEDMAEPKYALWYRSLASAWESGGRAAALDFLELNRERALASLKLKQQ